MGGSMSKSLTRPATGAGGDGSKPAGKTAAEYLALPYHLLVVRDGEEKDAPWTAFVEELPGCTSRGRSSEEALAGIEAVMEKWMAVAIEEGRDIPEPRSASTHSGRLLLRMPRTLHADLTRASEREGVSLNQFITDVLAGAVGWRSAHTSTPEAAATPINQAPGADGLTAGPSTKRRARGSTRFTNAALAANFLIVGLAAIVAIVVLILAAG
jgi:predicted RNase H-like HicB family nuclease